MATKRTTPIKNCSLPLGFLYLINKPKAIATTINNIEIDAAAAFGVFNEPSELMPLNVVATISAKATITSNEKIQANKKNNFLPALPIYCSIIAPIDFPWLFTDAYNAPKSCTAPKKIPPIRSHNKTGT